MAEAFAGENLFRTSDSMYFGWHVAGTTLHLNRTNPGASKPSWTGEWWTRPSTRSRASSGASVTV